jgi:TolB protein
VLISLTLVLAVLPSCTLAKDAAEDLLARYALQPPRPAVRNVDTWFYEHTNSLFCFNCHSLLYPLPPENLPTSPKTSVAASEKEPGLKRLTDNPGRDVEAVYSPRGDKIVWATDSLGNWTLWTMNDDGSDKRQLTSGRMISGWPSWSPDGQEMAYWSYDPTSKTCDIWKAKVDGSSRVRLTTDGTLKEPPAWSPRGDRIAYISNQTGNMEVYVMNKDGSGTKHLTKGHASIGFGCYIQGRVCWHPDGVRLYFEEATFPIPTGILPVVPSDVATVAIHVVNVDTGSEEDLTPRCHDYPMSFNPDGKRLATISFRTPNYGLWIMNADGTNQTRLTWDGQGDRDPRFCPDGKKILYWSLASGNPDIWTINPDGGNKTRLTWSPYQDVYPSWSPNGKKIIFESDRAGDFDIWQLSLDNSMSVDVKFERCAVPGGSGKALLTVKPLGNAGSSLRVEKVGVHFDWDPEGKYVENLSAPHATPIGSNDALDFSLDFSVPKNAVMGYHFYDVRVQYSYGNGAAAEFYEHSAGDLSVGTSEQTDCDALYIRLSGKLERLHAEAMSRSISMGEVTSECTVPLKGYFDYLLSPDAEHFLKANDEFYQAKSLYLSRDYSAALPHFKTTERLLSEGASKVETEQNMSIPLILSTFMALTLSILILFLIVRSKRNLSRSVSK